MATLFCRTPSAITVAQAKLPRWMPAMRPSGRLRAVRENINRILGIKGEAHGRFHPSRAGAATVGLLWHGPERHGLGCLAEDSRAA